MCGNRETDPAEPRGVMGEAWVHRRHRTADGPDDPSGERAPLSCKPSAEHGVDPTRLRWKTARHPCCLAVFAAPHRRIAFKNPIFLLQNPTYNPVHHLILLESLELSSREYHFS
jgi:hypothetical protein